MLLLSIATRAQEIRDYDLEMQANHARTKGYDPEYRVNYFENIILRTALNSTVGRLQFKSGKTGEILSLRPVAQNQLGYSFDYKWLAVGFAYTPGVLLNTRNSEELEESKSVAFDINFFYSDQWRQELSYRYYKGFLIDNPQPNVANNQAYLKNTTLAIVEGSTFYIQNRNFSFRAHYAQTERQLRSAGSLIPRLRYAYSISNPNFENEPMDDGVLQLNSIDILAQVGYLYTFVYDEKLFLTAGLHTGVGYNNSAYKYEGGAAGEEIFNTLTFAVNGDISAGYNSYRWFFGTSLNWRNYDYTNIRDDTFSIDKIYLSAFLGYRLNDNKPMRKFFGWFEDHLGF
jgi:hypothetical protein